MIFCCWNFNNLNLFSSKIVAWNDAKAETPVLWPLHTELTYWKRLWCWEGLGAEGEGNDRGWDGWMASLTGWSESVNSRNWWWTGRPGVLRFMGSQRVGHYWATGLNWTESQSPNPSLLYPPAPLWQVQVCSLCLWVCFCFKDMPICIIF